MAAELLKSFVASNRVAVLSKTYCPYCVRAKQAIAGVGAQPAVLELDERDDGPAIQQAAFELTGQKTVPNVFVDGAHVGGCDKVVAMIQSGKFQALLQKAKA